MSASLEHFRHRTRDLVQIVDEVKARVGHGLEFDFDAARAFFQDRARVSKSFARRGRAAGDEAEDRELEAAFLHVLAEDASEIDIRIKIDRPPITTIEKICILS